MRLERFISNLQQGFVVVAPSRPIFLCMRGNHFKHLRPTVYMFWDHMIHKGYTMTAGRVYTGLQLLPSNTPLFYGT